MFYKNTCQICGDRFPRKLLSIDHVIPSSKGGENTTTNKLIACKRCNCKKSNLTPYFDHTGKELTGTKIPANYIFIDEHDMREEWKKLVWHK